MRHVRLLVVMLIVFNSFSTITLQTETLHSKNGELQLDTTEYLFKNDSLSLRNSNRIDQSFNSFQLTSKINNGTQFCTTSPIKCIVLTLLFGGFTICTIIGNSFVIAAIVLEKNLHSNVGNYLIASLASADLLVAIMVSY
jgi:hypothetical protein